MSITLSLNLPETSSYLLIVFRLDPDSGPEVSGLHHPITVDPEKVTESGVIPVSLVFSFLTQHRCRIL